MLLFVLFTGEVEFPRSKRRKRRTSFCPQLLSSFPFVPPQHLNQYLPDHSDLKFIRRCLEYCVIRQQDSPWGGSGRTPRLWRPIPYPHRMPYLQWDSLSYSTTNADHRQPACPMYKSSTDSFPPQYSSNPPADAASCPIAAPKNASPNTSSALSRLNPLNYMPSTLSQERASQQTRALPTSRTTSSIPRGDTNTNWEYPSPQQMYNAMLRKGYDDTPEDAVESMVAVHNFLNEGAWNEIEGWEARFSGGLFDGWKACRRGEEGWEEMVLNGTWRPREGDAPKLLRFMGRPGDMTPKAKMLDWIGRLYPTKFG